MGVRFLKKGSGAASASGNSHTDEDKGAISQLILCQSRRLTLVMERIDHLGCDRACGLDVGSGLYRGPWVTSIP